MRSFYVAIEDEALACLSDPEVVLAWAVIVRAVKDARTTRQDGGVPLSTRAEAHHFLAHRLWEPDNLWGLAVGPSIRASFRRRIRHEFR